MELVLMTDFGLKDGAVAAMKGVAQGVARNLARPLPITDLTHDIPPFDIAEAAYRLRQTAPYWPAGTVFVTVVDPGVGTARKSVAARDVNGRIFVCPDNGLLTHLADEIGFESVREIDEIAHRLPGSSESFTFLGRDLYAFIGARLASGDLQFDDIGPSLPEITRLEVHHATVLQNGGLEDRVIGSIPVLDVNFGNVWTNIPKHLLEQVGVNIGDQVQVVIKHNELERYREVIPFVHSFGFVPHGERLVYVNSLLHASLGMNCSSFAAHYGISSGAGWTVELGPA
jgi:S-adenosylmethionine hydrolase